jgi:hypothetical protein
MGYPRQVSLEKRMLQATTAFRFGNYTHNPGNHLHLASPSIIRNLVSMRVFDVETKWVGQLKSFVPPLEQKDARKEAKSLIYDGGLSLKDAMARTEATRS